MPEILSKAFDRLDAARALMMASPCLDSGVPIATFDASGPFGAYLDLVALMRPTRDGRDFEVQHLNAAEASRVGFREGCPMRDVLPRGLHDRVLESGRRMLTQPGLWSIVGIFADDLSDRGLAEAAGFFCPVSANGRRLTHVAGFLHIAAAPRGSIARLFHDGWTPFDRRAFAC